MSTHSGPARYPRSWLVNTSFYALLPSDQAPAVAGTKTEAIDWIRWNSLRWNKSQPGSDQEASRQHERQRMDRRSPNDVQASDDRTKDAS